MPMFDENEVIETTKYDRVPLPDGVYLVEVQDFAEIYGGYKGGRTQLNYKVLKGRNAPVGTEKRRVWMENHKGEHAETNKKRDNGKKRAAVAAILGVESKSVTNAVYYTAVREVRGKSDPEEGFIIKSENRPAAKNKGTGKKVKLVVESNKKGFPEQYFSPFSGDESEFEEYVPRATNLGEDDVDRDDDTADELAKAAEAQDEAEGSDEPAIEDEPEVSPIDKALADGWKYNSKSPAGKKYYFKGKEQLLESALVAKYS